MAQTAALRKHLTVADGFALYTTAVLGQSLIVLPSIAARDAGPWSILLWLGLSLVTYPMARVMAELGGRYPSAGGVTAFISAGLGRWAGELTGIIYLVAIAIGAPVASIFFMDYLEVLLGLPPSVHLWGAVIVMLLPIAVNAADVSWLMRWQRWALIGCLVAVLVSIASALPHVSVARLTDIQGYTMPGIAATSVLCFFAFVGWENASFAGEEFTDHATLLKALRAAVITVGGLFVLLGFVVVGSLSRATIAHSDTALSDLLAVSLGANAARVAAGIALLIILLLMISWARSASRLVVALARERLLPRALAHIAPGVSAPRHALLALAGIELVGMTAFILSGAHVADFLQLSSVNFVMTYALIFVAAWRLLALRRFGWLLLASSAAVALLVAASYQHLLFIGVSILLYGLIRVVKLRGGMMRGGLVGE